MSTINPTTVPSKRLAESITGASTSFKLNSITGWDGQDLTSSDFGTVAYAVFRNSASTLMEIMEIDPTTITSASSAIDINKRGLMFTGDLTTEVAGNKLTWVKGDTIVELGTDAPQLLKSFVDIYSAQTIEGIKTFSSLPRVPLLPLVAADATSKQYVDDTVTAGAPDASAVTKGITLLSTAPASPTSPIAVGDNDARVPTTGENNALVGNNTDIAVGTSNKFVTQTGLQKSEESYAASSSGNDTYAVTLSPVPTSYVNGMVVKFKPDTANTGAATLNVNSLGAITIKKNRDRDLETGDIEANQLVVVVYNSTGPVFEMVSQLAQEVADSVSYSYTAGENLTQGDALKIVLPTAETSHNTQTLDERDINNSGSVTRIGNLVTPGAITFVNYVIVHIKKTGSPGTLNVELWSADPSSGSLLETATVAEGSISTSNAEVTVNFVNVHKFGASDTFSIVLRPTTADASNHISWSGSNVGGGAGTLFWVYTGSWASQANPALYLKYGINDGTAGQVKKAKATTSGEAGLMFGFAAETATSGNTVRVKTTGPATTSGLTAGWTYFLSNTAGAVATTAGTTSKKVGLALTTTSLNVNIDN